MSRATTPTPDRAMTPAQIAERYGVSSDKVRGWIQAGDLAAVNVAARASGRPRWVVTPEALAAFEAARSAQPTPKVQRRRRRQASDVIEFV